MKRTLKQVEQKMKLSDFDVKGRKPNQSGGLAYMLGEPTYSDGGRIGFKDKGRVDEDDVPSKYTAVPEDMTQEEWEDAIKALIARSRERWHGKYQSGGLAYMLGEPTYSDGGRIGFKGGTKFDPTKRSFLKIAAGLAALPFVGKFFKWAKPAAKVLTKVPIEQTGGMPVWFPKLVNKVVNEGTDVTKKLGTVEREIVHTKKIGAKGTYAGDEVTVYRNLDSGNVRVEYGPPLLDEQGKIIRASNDNAVINLEYKAPVEDITSKGKPIKTKSEFSAVESEPEVVNWEGDIEFSGENVVNRVEDLVTDTSELQKYATGKKLTIKELSESMNKQKYKNKLETDVMEQVDYIENKGGGYASMEDILDEGKRVGDLDPKGYDPQNVVKGQNLPKEYHERQIKEYMEKTKKASGGRVPFISGGDAEDYGELIDAYEAGIDVMPGETLTDYINRIRKAEKRRKNKASGGLAYMLGE
jgi:hypothetical protein